MHMYLPLIYKIYETSFLLKVIYYFFLETFYVIFTKLFEKALNKGAIYIYDILESNLKSLYFRKLFLEIDVLLTASVAGPCCFLTIPRRSES